MNEAGADTRQPLGHTEIQEFLAALQHCLPELCARDSAGFYSSSHFDPRRRTLTVPRLDCSILNDQDLQTFRVLAHLHGDLVIRDNPGLTCLDGLRNLETVSGRLELGNCGIRELSGLTRLRRAGEILIRRMVQLRTITGFTSLEECGQGLTIAGNPVLARITGFTSLTRLGNGSLTVRDNPALVSICGLNGLAAVGRGLSVCNCPQLADFRFLSALEAVHSLEISATALADGSPLQRLFARNPQFKGAIRLTRNPNLADLSFMRGLTAVGSSLYLDQNGLADLRGLEQLRRVDASLNLAGNRLADISQLAALEDLDGVLLLSSNRLQSLRGLENLRRIRSKEWGKELVSIRISDNRDEQGNITLTDIGALANVYEVTGRLVMYTDSERNHRYLAKPGAESVFYTRNAGFRIYGRTSATPLPLDHVCALPRRARVPMLFPDMSTAWQENLRHCQGIAAHFLPFASVEELLSCCRARNITVLVPIKMTSQKFVAAHAPELRRHGLRFIANDEQTLNNCENKRDFKRFMDGHGFADYVPAYYQSPETASYPCVVKPFHGSFGSGQRIAFSREEVGAFGREEVLTQLIPGPVEYATHCFFLDRQTYRDVTYRKTYNKPHFILGKEDKASLLYERVATPFLDLLLDILASIRFRGICCIDYKPLDNVPKIFEINARIGYTLSAHAYDLSQMLGLYMTHAE